ncbi:cysteine desulfurase [Rhizomicrobium palustre]|uniref:Cysteine desulfurase n=1 Tax=Rhizomicrobium palustre TaxID=189966 RepID=A0A846N208_9PROT|nr:aminotransferase class V-fold PLP-dependent enzyme [Rhizomicrobium palustre]NIK89177.1 cysteine desulfurase [Rhizomicrobium palustre]
MRWAYFDNNATTRTAPEVVEAMLPFFTGSFGNPSSSHDFGKAAAVAMSGARRQVQTLIGAEHEQEIVFTSGATEANNAALLQALRREDRNEVIVSTVEHPAILGVVADQEKHHGVIVHRIGVDGRGRLDMVALTRVLSRRTALVSVMWANNETGTIFPVAEIAALAHEAGALMHCDAVQAVGKLPIDVKSTKIDMLSLSAHKFHGPKGIGALYLRKSTKFRAFLRGGRQERARRAGTENVPAIVGLGKAAELAVQRLPEDGLRIAALRDRLEHAVLICIEGSAVLGDREHRVPGTSAIAFAGADSEEVLFRLNKAGIAASSGSACTSGNIEPSHVLKAMRVPYASAMGAVRFSLSRANTAEDIEHLMQVLPGIVAGSRSPSAALAS